MSDKNEDGSIVHSLGKKGDDATQVRLIIMHFTWHKNRSELLRNKKFKMDDRKLFVN